MKRILLCLCAVAAVASCSKDETTDPANTRGNETLILEAGTVAAEPEIGNRAGYDGVKSIWHSGDAIGVTLGADNSNLQFTMVPGSLAADGTSARFTGTLTKPVTGNVDCVAYFPYTSSASVSGKTITTTFPPTQTYVAGGYRGIPLFGSYTGDVNTINVPFKNLFSIIKLTLVKGVSLSGTVNLTSIVFGGNNNETISGAMAVNLTDAALPTVSYTGTGKTVVLDLGGGVELTTTGTTFYLAVPAIDYTKGYTLTFITDKGQVSKTAKSAGATYAANTMYKAPSLTIDSFSPAITIPDSNLREALANLGLISLIDNVLGTVNITTAGLKTASIDVSGKSIASLAGLENFPALVTLKAGNNNLASVDLSKLTLLTNLDLSANNLTALDLAANTKLLSLNISGNRMGTLDVSANTLLTNLNVSSNRLSTLNLAANAALLTLDVSSNLLTSLDLHNNILLTSAKVYGNPLVTLNISGLKALLSLNLVNGAESVNTVTKTLTVPAAATVQNIVSDGVALTNWLNFVCNNNPNVTSISLKNNTGLLAVTAAGNTKLTTLDVSGNATLTHVTANSNALTSVNLAGDLALLSLNVASNKLPSVNLAGQTLMTSLDVSSNLLTSLDLHNNVALTSAKVYGNTLTTLNISGLVALLQLYLDNTGTNAINLLKLTIPVGATVQNLIANSASAAVNWTAFDCTANPNIVTISLQNNTLLTSVTAKNNTKLTSLNVKGCTLLTVLGAIQTSGNASGFTVTGPL